MILSSLKMVDTKMTVGMILSLFVVFLASRAAAEQVPTIMWSSQSYLHDLPPARAGHSLSPIDLQHDYLDTVIAKRPQLIVLFIQDKLSLDDFSQYGDVYDGNSNGGLFSNLKSSMDRASSSLVLSSELPASPGLHGNQVATYLQGRVDGSVIPVELSLTEIRTDGKKLQLDKNCLILVRLPQAEGSIEESLKRNNDIIGSVIKSLPKELDFTIILTANRPSKVSVVLPSHDSLSSGRHLLADLDAVDNTTYTFINATKNDSCAVYLYATDVSFKVSKQSDSGQFEDTVNLTAVVPASTTVTCGSGTVELALKYSNVGNLKNLDMVIPFDVTKRQWSLGNITLQYDYQSDQETVKGSDKLVPKFTATPRKMSFHCDKPKQFRELSTDKDNNTQGVISFKGLQIQPVDIQNGSFSNANECVGFFTAPIWMGLLTSIILTVILAFGMMMIMSLKTMDRFDDPKGKMISINAGE
ncbi:V-type proton ATPase subunit S1-like isoform X1 [Branchiostoma floridae]|uniref:V-type proton ATPase subunit S1-like isoform X1 n=1 Tax=Branchiostoma floridae TaxID=7739 RepID=A0A9J7L7L0_BRAFL|nr:V-type proton ATPase subunit S1-like isoform X1 [Branchiostoma floridae]